MTSSKLNVVHGKSAICHRGSLHYTSREYASGEKDLNDIRVSVVNINNCGSPTVSMISNVS